MQLIQLKKLVPIRNEKGEIYKWHEEDILLSPSVVLRAQYQPTLDHAVVRLTNGEEVIIEDSVKGFNEKFRVATISHA